MVKEAEVVGVVANDPLRRMGLQTILEENIGLLSRATSLDEAIDAKGLSAVLLDSACVPDVVEAIERFQRERPALKVVVVGDASHAEHMQAVMAAGARGYVPASASEAEMREAMEAVLRGSVWAPRKVLAKLIERGEVMLTPQQGAERLTGQMTRRELQLLGLLKFGQTNRQIAAALGVEVVTVKAHLGRMLRKVGAKNRIELTLKAIAEGPDAS